MNLNPLLFFMLPTCAFLMLGLVFVMLSETSHKRAIAMATQEIPKEANWSTWGELAMAFILANAGFYFATQCLRGFSLFVASAIILTALVSIGCHYRYHQVVQQLDLEKDTLKRLRGAHAFLSIGIFLTIGPELALILLFIASKINSLN